MWVRKTLKEIATERAKRYKKTRFIFYGIEGLSFYFVANKYSEFGSLITLLKTDPEAISLLLLPLFLYFAYKNYVLTGFVIGQQPMMCLHCEKGMGSSDDGWGFKVFGKKKPKWYQVRACKTNDKCDIVYMYQAKIENGNED